MIPETQCLDALLHQEFFTRFISLNAFRQTVLKTIQFDSQLCVGAVKIQNVLANCVLPAKFETSELPASQCPPEFFSSSV